MSTRRSPIENLVSNLPGATFARADIAAIAQPAGLAKFGVKGKGLTRWAAEHRLDLPGALYEAKRTGRGGWLVRVGSEEILLDGPADAAERSAFEAAQRQPGSDLYPVEQQGTTFELTGPRSAEVLAQMCGVDLGRADPDRIVYTRLAGVSCGVIPSRSNNAATYTIWVDYSFAPYLWETFVQIISELK